MPGRFQCHIKLIAGLKNVAFTRVLLWVAVGLVHAQFVAGDQYYNQQALSTINALSAYTQGYSGSGVTIGVVDSGLDPNHIAFSGALVGAMGWSRTDPADLLVNNWVSQTNSNFASFLNDYKADGVNDRWSRLFRHQHCGRKTQRTLGCQQHHGRCLQREQVLKALKPT